MLWCRGIPTKLNMQRTLLDEWEERLRATSQLHYKQCIINACIILSTQTKINAHNVERSHNAQTTMAWSLASTKRPNVTTTVSRCTHNCLATQHATMGLLLLLPCPYPSIGWPSARFATDRSPPSFALGAKLLVMVGGHYHLPHNRQPRTDPEQPIVKRIIEKNNWTV